MWQQWESTFSGVSLVGGAPFYCLKNRVEENKEMKRKFLLIVAVLMVLLAGCSSEDDGKIHMPFGANDYDDINYQEIVSQLEEAGFTNVREEPLGDLVTGWLNDEGEVDEVSVDGDTVFSTDSRYLPDVEIVVSYHTFPGEEESSTEDENETSENIESTNEVPEENLTPENNEDLVAVLSATNELDPIYSEFAEKYKNQIVEFDACITYLANHGDNDTRYDLLLSAGDYVDENTVNPGPIFKFEDVNTYGMGIEDLYLPDYISIGSNVHVVAEIQSFSEDEGVFFLNPVKVIPR